MEKIRKKPNTRKKQSNQLGKDNWLLRSTDKGKLCNISLTSDDSPLQRTIWACNCGWLLISQQQGTESCNSYQFSVWKPESSEMINLPALNLKPNQIIHAGTLVSCPGNPGFMVLLFEEVLRCLIFYRFGDKQPTKRWVGKEMAAIGQGDAKDRIYKNYITQCNGKLYAASFRTGKLMLMEENRSKNLKLRSLNLRLPRSPSPSIRPTEYLLDFCGQLCFVAISWGGVNYQDIVDIEVSKLQLSSENRMEWVKVTSAEGQAFFLSDNYAFSCPVNESEIEGGCVYFSQNNRFYSANIEDKSVSVSLPLENLLLSENSPFLSMHVFRFGCPQAKSESIISKLEADEKGEREVIEDNGNIICGLPWDILEFITKKLNPVDYCNFRSVCNTFRSVAPQIKWSDTSCDFECQSLCPWLIFRKGSIHNFVDPHCGGRYLMNIPPCLLEAKIRYSKGGWLLMYTSNSLFFYNPFKKERIELPQEEEGQECCLGYGLSSSPTPETIVVGIGFYSIYYFSWREREWNEYVFPDLDFKTNHNSPIYFDGAFYFLDQDGKLGVFQWKDGEVSWEILTELKSPCKDCCYNYLLECSGNLLSVFVDDELIRVYKLIYRKVNAWKKVTSLENHALFVSPSTSFSITPYFSDMKNKIYFPKFSGKDIVYYCLSTNKFYTCESKEVVTDFKNTTEFLFSSWIQPSWSS